MILYICICYVHIFRLFHANELEWHIHYNAHSEYQFKQ